MCADVIIGEEISHSSHSVTGLLSPLLLAVAAILLVAIAFVDFFKKRYRVYKKKSDEKKAKDEVKRLSIGKQESVHSTIQLGNQLNKNDLSKIFSQVERRGSVWDERVGGRLVRLTEEMPPNESNAHHNQAYSVNDDDEFDQNSTSLETLRHLLNSKPWATKASIENTLYEEDEPSKPSFYLKDSQNHS